jgi:hypothetical protein
MTLVSMIFVAGTSARLLSPTMAVAPNALVLRKRRRFREDDMIWRDVVPG